MASPTPPVNVRLAYADGTQVPVDCLYAGMNGEGLHQWEVINPRAQMPRKMLVDTLPARTAISVSSGESLPSSHAHRSRQLPTVHVRAQGSALPSRTSAVGRWRKAFRRVTRRA